MTTATKKVFTVCTFGSTNWKAAERAANVRGKQRISRGVYAHPSQARSVAMHAVSLGSCTLARVAECDSEELSIQPDVSLAGGDGWRWI